MFPRGAKNIVNVHIEVEDNYGEINGAEGAKWPMICELVCVDGAYTRLQKSGRVHKLRCSRFPQQQAACTVLALLITQVGLAAGQERHMDINRVIVIVIDSVGIGEAPDAAAFGDTGSNTLGNIARVMGGLTLA